MGRPRTRIVQLSMSVMIRHRRPGPLSAADVCLRHAFQSYLCFGSVHSRCVPLRPRSALRAILMCGCRTPSNHICALDRCISDVFPYRLVREKRPPPLPLPCKVGSRCSVQSCVKKAPAEMLVYAASKSTLNQGGQGAFFTHQPVSTISVLISFATSCLL